MQASSRVLRMGWWGPLPSPSVAAWTLQGCLLSSACPTSFTCACVQNRYSLGILTGAWCSDNVLGRSSNQCILMSVRVASSLKGRLPPFQCYHCPAVTLPSPPMARGSLRRRLVVPALGGLSADLWWHQCPQKASFTSDLAMFGMHLRQH